MSIPESPGGIRRATALARTAAASCAVLLAFACIDGAPDRSAPPVRDAEAPGGVLVVRGAFDAAGATLTKLERVRRLPWTSGPVPDQASGHFAVRATTVPIGGADANASRTLVVPFDALVASAAGTRHGFFEVIVPVSGEVLEVRVTDSAGRVTYATVAGEEIADER